MNSKSTISKAALALFACFLTVQATPAKADEQSDNFRKALGLHSEVNQHGVIVKDKPNGRSEIWNSNKDFHVNITFEVNIGGTICKDLHMWLPAFSSYLIDGREVKITNVELSGAGYGNEK